MLLEIKTKQSRYENLKADIKQSNINWKKRF
jgi:hypothetical protein